MYLIDTNVLIRSLYGFEPESTFLKKVIKKNSFIISAIVVAEFLVKADAVERKTFFSLIEDLKVFPIDRVVAEMAAEYRKQSLKKKRADLLDCFLAAQAKLNNLTLVTNNKSDFPMKDIKIISP